MPLWVANVWLVAFPRSTAERLHAQRVFEEIVGDFRGYDHVKYKLAHSGETGLVQGLLPPTVARSGECQRLREVLSGRVRTPLLTRDALGRKLSPDIVCSSDELAALAAVPSTKDLARSVRERVDHRPGSATLDTQFTPAQREYYVNDDDPVKAGSHPEDRDPNDEDRTSTAPGNECQSGSERSPDSNGEDGNERVDEEPMDTFNRENDGPDTGSDVNEADPTGQ